VQKLNNAPTCIRSPETHQIEIKPEFGIPAKLISVKNDVILVNLDQNDNRMNILIPKMNTANKSIFTLCLRYYLQRKSTSTPSATNCLLDQPDLSTASQGWGNALQKKIGRLDGNYYDHWESKTFERGFGINNAESSLFIQLDGKANSFIAQAGISMMR